jgi:hypothetical protein
LIIIFYVHDDVHVYDDAHDDVHVYGDDDGGEIARLLSLDDKILIVLEVA